MEWVAPRSADWAATVAPLSPPLSPSPPPGVVTDAVTCAQAALCCAKEALHATAAGVKGLGHFLEHSGLIRVIEAIPVVAPLFLCLTAVCTKAASVATEQAELAPALRAATRKAELCLRALGLTAALLPTDDFVVGRVKEHLMELEEDVARLLHYQFFGRLRGLLLCATAGLPSLVRAHLLDLLEKLPVVMQFAALEHLLKDRTGPAHAVLPTVTLSDELDGSPRPQQHETTEVELVIPSLCFDVPALSARLEGREQAATVASGNLYSGGMLRPSHRDDGEPRSWQAASGSAPYLEYLDEPLPWDRVPSDTGPKRLAPAGVPMKEPTCLPEGGAKEERRVTPESGPPPCLPRQGSSYGVALAQPDVVMPLAQQSAVLDVQAAGTPPQSTLPAGLPLRRVNLGGRAAPIAGAHSSAAGTESGTGARPFMLGPDACSCRPPAPAAAPSPRAHQSR